MNLSKSKIIGGKPHLWEMVKTMRKELEPYMETIYGDPCVASLASTVIRDYVSTQAISPADKKSVESWLYSSFMAANGFHLKKESPAPNHDRFEDIYERLSQIEARLGIVPK